MLDFLTWLGSTHVYPLGANSQKSAFLMYPLFSVTFTLQQKYLLQVPIRGSSGQLAKSQEKNSLRQSWRNMPWSEALIRSCNFLDNYNHRDCLGTPGRSGGMEA